MSSAGARQELCASAKELTVPCWPCWQPVRGIVQWMVERKVIQEDQAARLKQGGSTQQQLVLSNISNAAPRTVRCVSTNVFTTCVQ